MRAALRIHAAIGQAQSFHGPSTQQVFGNNFLGILRFHVAVPYSIRIHHDRRAVFTLVQAAGLVDAHLSAEPGLARKLLQPGVQAAGAIGGTRGARRIGRADVVADKNVTFKRGQSAILLGTDSRVTRRRDWRTEPWDFNRQACKSFPESLTLDHPHLRE